MTPPASAPPGEPGPPPLPQGAFPIRVFGLFDPRGRAEALDAPFAAMARLFPESAWRLAALSANRDAALHRRHRLAVALPARAGVAADSLLRRAAGRAAAGPARLFAAAPAPPTATRTDPAPAHAEAADVDALMAAEAEGLFDREHVGPSPLEGDFAVALAAVDPPRLTLLRDPMAVRPMFWRDLGGGAVAWANWPHALLALPDAPRDPDPQALGRYMRDWRAPTPQGTLWPGLNRLPAGHRLTADAQGARAVRWWRPGADPALAGLRPSAALVLLRDRLAQAVLSRRARVGGDPGALYSGGLDSSMVAGVLMGARPEGPLRLYALSSDRTEEDRLCRAAFGARWPASTLTEVPPGEVDPLEGPVHLWGRLAAPCADTSLPLISQAMRRAAQTGEAALLDGFGGDFQISALGESTLIEALLSARFGLAADAWRAMRRAGMGRRNLIALRLLAPLPGLAGAAALAAHGTERRPTPLRQAYDLRRTDRLPLRQRSADVEAMVMHQDVYPGEQELWDRPGAPPDQMPRLSPLLDTRLMSAIAGAPAALRVAGGWHRALPRALLDGLAPDEIRRRRGKNPTQPETWARAAQAMRARPDAWRAFREDPLWREVIDVEAADALYAALESRRDFAAMRPVAAAWHLGEFLRLAAAGGPP